MSGSNNSINAPLGSKSRKLLAWFDPFWQHVDSCQSRPRKRSTESDVQYLDVRVSDGHLRRYDFSNWVAEVVGDYPLAKQVRILEEEHAAGAGGDVTARITKRSLAV